MSDLATRNCKGPARQGIAPEQIPEMLKQLTDWKVIDDHHLFRHFGFDDFVTALDFTNRAGAIAEDLGHHPNIHLTWGKVEIEIYTHDADGLSECDFILAARLDQL